MTIPMSASDVLDREFLEVRAKILELAAALDRLDRADGKLDADVRLTRLHEGIRELQSESMGRAERVQQIFSRAYQPQWRQQFFPEA